MNPRPRARQPNRRPCALGVGLALTLGTLVFSLGPLAQDALGAVRVGGGLGWVAGQPVLMGRAVVDLVPLLVATVAFDAELWAFSASGQQFLPFLSVSAFALVKLTAGLAPIISLSEAGIQLIAGTLAVKGALGFSLGPLELFAEGIFLAAPANTVLVDGPFLAVGALLGF